MINLVTANSKPAKITAFSNNSFIAKFDRNSIIDLGNGTGDIDIEGSITSGRLFKAVVTVNVID